jgi:hypothetical protein
MSVCQLGKLAFDVSAGISARKEGTFHKGRHAMDFVSTFQSACDRAAEPRATRQVEQTVVTF